MSDPSWFDLAIPIIRKHEGLRLEAYRDPVGVWTIGYGHTGTAREGMTITPAEAERLLRLDMAKAEDAVDRYVRAKLNPHQKAALVSFTFNLGGGALRRSTLLKHLNRGDYRAAADEFPRWNKADGTVLPGLVKRRADERALFLTPQTVIGHIAAWTFGWFY